LLYCVGRVSANHLRFPNQKDYPVIFKFKQKTAVQSVSALMAAVIFIMPQSSIAGLLNETSPYASGTSAMGVDVVAPEHRITIENLTTPVQPVIILAMGNANTTKVVVRLTNGKSQCAAVSAEYQADCLSQTFRSASRTARSLSDYVAVGKVLAAAHKRIDALVSKNLDKNAPTIRKGGKKLRAVKKSAVAKVNAQTRKIIAETETKLLRSAGNSAKRKAHFGRIAKAAGSTKTILRSA